MTDKSLRSLARAYFEEQCDRETYLRQRTQLIDQITEESIANREQSTPIPIAKYAIVAGIITLVVIGGVFWALKNDNSTDTTPSPVDVAITTPTVETTPDVVKPPKRFVEQEPQPSNSDALSEVKEELSVETATEDEPQIEVVEQEPQLQPDDSEVTETEAPLVAAVAEESQIEEMVGLAEQEKAKIEKMLRQCQTHFNAKRLTTGYGGTALVCYQEVLALDSDNAKALAGLKAIEQRYKVWAESALDRKNFSRVKKYLARLEKVNPQSPVLAHLRQRLERAEREAERR